MHHYDVAALILLDLDFDTLLVGDGEPILSGAKDRLRELVTSFT